MKRKDGVFNPKNSGTHICSEELLGRNMAAAAAAATELAFASGAPGSHCRADRTNKHAVDHEKFNGLAGSLGGGVAAACTL